MVSIITCSVNDEQYFEFEASVTNTIGVPFEIIRIDNRSNAYSICAAYNEGARRARFDVLCFSHEDIQFITKDWGKDLCTVLDDRKIGLVGVYGICFHSHFPVGWYASGEFEGQVVLGMEADAKADYHVRFPSEKIADVAGVDGLFMATRRGVFDRYKFAEEILKGFHGYDMDYSLQVGQTLRVVVTRNILLKHASGGQFNDAYYEAMAVIGKRWHDAFPVHVAAYSTAELKALNLRALNAWRKSSGKTWESRRTAIRYARKNEVLIPFLRGAISSS